jgi:CheY-like chemotaxis protein
MAQRVLAAVDDMFFAAKIKATAEHLGIDIRFVRSAEAAVESARRERPALIIVDLHSRGIDPFALAESLKSDEQLRGLSLIGFFSHVQTELQRRAEQAGYDRVMPRSAFTKHLAEILVSNSGGA